MSTSRRILPLRSAMSRILKTAPLLLVWLLLALGAGLHAATNPDPCDAKYDCGDPPTLNGVYNDDGPSTLCPKDTGDWSITENKTDGKKTKKDCSSDDKTIGLKNIYWEWTLEGPGLLHGRLQGFGTSVNWTPDGNVFVGWPGEYTITWVGHAEQDDPDSDCTGDIDSSPVTTTFTILAPAATAKIDDLTDVCPGEGGDLSFTISDTTGCSNDYRWTVEDLGAGDLIFTLGPPKEGTVTAGSSTQVSGDRDGNLSGRVKGASGGNSVDLGFSTNAKGDLIYDGKVAIKTGEVDASVSVNGENSDATLKADVAKGKNHLGATIDQGGKVRQVRVGLGNDTLFADGIYNPFDDSYDVKGELPIVPGDTGAGKVTVSLSRDAGGVVKVGADGTGSLNGKPITLGFHWMDSNAVDANFAYGKELDAMLHAKDGRVEDARLHAHEGSTGSEFDLLLEMKRDAAGVADSTLTLAHMLGDNENKLNTTATVEAHGFDLKKVKLMSSADVHVLMGGGAVFTASGAGGIDLMDDQLELKANPNVAAKMNVEWSGQSLSYKLGGFARHSVVTDGGSDWGLGAEVSRTIIGDGRYGVGLNYYTNRPGEEHQLKLERVFLLGVWLRY